MAAIHPHTEATYLVSELADGTFGVEVTIPETQPTKITGLASQAAAEAWIERHKNQIATGSIRRKSAWGRGSNRSQP
jgi:hypothetical protein